MSTVNVTIRLDEDVKREFDEFCENVGISITAAFNMFIRATLRTRELPFPVTDAPPVSRVAVIERGLEALKEAQSHAKSIGTSGMTLEEINELISDTRREKKNAESCN